MGYTNDWYVIEKLEPIPKDVLEQIRYVLKIFSDPKITTWDCIRHVNCEENSISFQDIGTWEEVQGGEKEHFRDQDFLFDTKHLGYKFCKTNRSAYCLPMKIVLIILKNHYKEKLKIIASDLNYWLSAILFCKVHFDIIWEGPDKSDYDKKSPHYKKQERKEIQTDFEDIFIISTKQIETNQNQQINQNKMEKSLKKSKFNENS